MTELARIRAASKDAFISGQLGDSLFANALLGRRGLRQTLEDLAVVSYLEQTG
ncbi:MAG: hypothetical protein Q9181_005637 [Wetmoreana brouardii]